MSRFGFIRNKLDIKFLILYIMARVASPIDFPTLTDLTMCDEGVDYFDFAESVAELVDTGHLTLENDLYAITDKGRSNGAACESSLPYTVKQKCGVNLARINGILRRNAQVRAHVEDRPEGGSTVKRELDDDKGNLFTLELFCGTREQAQRMAKGVKEEPERVYNDVITALLEWEKNR